MNERVWLSPEKMFWQDSEWNEAYQQLSEQKNDLSMNGSAQMQFLISYLMKNYPVTKEQLQEAKQKYTN